MKLFRLFQSKKPQYKFDTLEDIESIEIPKYKPNKNIESPVNNIEYILQRKATEHWRKGNQDLAIACHGLNIERPTVHRFRHTFAVEYILNGGDPFTLMRLLGHTTMWMVNRYLMFSRENLAMRHRSASPMDNWFGKK